VEGRWVEQRRVEGVASQMEEFLKLEGAQTYQGMQACGCIHDDQQSSPGTNQQKRVLIKLFYHHHHHIALIARL
jgi:hypothetical protein